jgi:hypothetical protein
MFFMTRILAPVFMLVLALSLSGCLVYGGRYGGYGHPPPPAYGGGYAHPVGPGAYPPPGGYHQGP